MEKDDDNDRAAIIGNGDEGIYEEIVNYVQAPDIIGDEVIIIDTSGEQVNDSTTWMEDTTNEKLKPIIEQAQQEMVTEAKCIKKNAYKLYPQGGPNITADSSKSAQNTSKLQLDHPLKNYNQSNLINQAKKYDNRLQANNTSLTSNPRVKIRLHENLNTVSTNRENQISVPSSLKALGLTSTAYIQKRDNINQQSDSIACRNLMEYELSRNGGTNAPVINNPINMNEHNLNQPDTNGSVTTVVNRRRHHQVKKDKMPFRSRSKSQVAYGECSADVPHDGYLMDIKQRKELRKLKANHTEPTTVSKSTEQIGQSQTQTEIDKNTVMSSDNLRQTKERRSRASSFLLPDRMESTDIESPQEYSIDSNTARSMRSQNADFNAKHQKFLNKIQISELEFDGFEDNSEPEVQEVSTPDNLLKEKQLIAPKVGWDKFCWRCHLSQPEIPCNTCTRSFHKRCLKQNKYLLPNDENQWSCMECMKFQSVDETAKESVDASIPITELLSFALNRMKQLPRSKIFAEPINRDKYPDYYDYVTHQVTFADLERNIKKNKYKTAALFLIDTLWILHNCFIYKEHKREYLPSAKLIVKVCRQEINEIETCSNCYYNANTRDEWFTDICPKPHILLWAKLKGFPYWPGKGMAMNAAGLIDVRFFGDHDRAWIPPRQCFLYSKADPNPPNKYRYLKTIETSLKELDIHVQKLKTRYGEFNYAPLRTPYDPHKEEIQLQMMIPNYNKIPKDVSNGNSNDSKTCSKLTYKIVKTADNNLSFIKKTDELIENATKSTENLSDSSKSEDSTIPLNRLKKSASKAFTCRVNIKKQKSTDAVAVDAPYQIVHRKLPTSDSVHKVDAVILKRKSENWTTATVASKRCKDSKDSDKAPSNPSNVDETISSPEPPILDSPPDTRSQMAISPLHDVNLVESSCNPILKSHGSENSKDDSTKTVIESCEKIDNSNQQTENNHDDLMEIPKLTKYDDNGEPTSCRTPSPVVSSICTSQFTPTSIVSNPAPVKTPIRLIPLAEIKQEPMTDETDFNESDQMDLCRGEIKTSPISKMSSITSQPSSTCMVQNIARDLLIKSEPDSENECQLECSGEVNNSNDVMNTDVPMDIEEPDENVQPPAMENVEANQTAVSTIEAMLSNTNSISITPVSKSITPTIATSSPTSAAAQLNTCSTGTPPMNTNPLHFLTTPNQTMQQSTPLSSIREQETIYKPDDRNTSKLSSILTSKKGSRDCHIQRARKSFPVVKKSTLRNILPANFIQRQSSSNNMLPYSQRPRLLSNLMQNSDIVPISKPSPPVPPLAVVSKNPAPVHSLLRANQISSTTDQNVVSREPPPLSTIATPVMNLSLNPSSVVETLSVTSTNDVQSRGLPKLTPRPAGPLRSSDGVPTVTQDMGPVSKTLVENAHKLSDFFMRTLEDTLSDLVFVGSAEAKVKSLELEIERLKAHHQKEMNDVKQGYEMQMSRLKASMEEEKVRIINDTRRLCELEKSRAVDETKKKQWCSACGKESLYYCCWNTSYCDQRCQEQHWPRHKSECNNETEQMLKKSLGNKMIQMNNARVNNPLNQALTVFPMMSQHQRLMTGNFVTPNLPILPFPNPNGNPKRNGK